MPEPKVQSLERTFSILGILAYEPNGLTLAEIADRVNLPRSTTFRLLAVLLQHEFARKSAETNLYRLGPGFIELSSHYLNNLELKTESAAFMNDLASTVGTIVFLARRQGNRIVYIDKQDKFSSLRKYAIIGQQKPLYCTSLGKALLMDMEDEEIRILHKAERFEKFGPNTHCCVEELIDDIHICRKRGWAWDNEEVEIGMNCVAAPIRDYRGQIISAISTSWVLANRLDLDPEKVAANVIKAADGISQAMGFLKPTA